MKALNRITPEEPSNCFYRLSLHLACVIDVKLKHTRINDKEKLTVKPKQMIVCESEKYENVAEFSWISVLWHFSSYLFCIYLI